MTLSIKSNFDITWFRIALEHERAALDARDRAEAAPEGSQEMGEEFDHELRAAMVAIAASAFAIDALYTTLNDMLEQKHRVRASDRVGYIVETLKTALDLGKRAIKWQCDIPKLFDLRDDLVHFRGEPNPGGMHPTGKANVSLEMVTYTAEATSEAVDLALEVLATAYRAPRSKHAAIVTWAKQGAHVPAWLESERAAVGSRTP